MMPVPPETVPEGELPPADISIRSEVDDGSDADSEAAEDAESENGGVRQHPRAWLYALTAALIIFFGTASETWAVGLALVLMGGTIILAPPRHRLRKIPLVALVWLGLAPAIGLLPASWFGPLEEWRVNLTTEWSVPLSSSVSPEMWTTLEAWVLMLTVVIWLWSCLGQNFSDGGRRVALRILGVAAVIIGIMSLLDVWNIVQIPWWPINTVKPRQVGMGPFANHNHASSYFALSSVLCAAAAYDAFRRQSRWWIIFGPGVLILLICIMVNTSRAGLALFFLGITLWLATAAMKRGLLRKAAVSTALVMTILSVALVAGGHLGKRLTSQPVSEMLGSDLRWWLAEETLTASAKAPWIGQGLGMYEKIIPLVGTTPFPELRPLHPESDVLWLLFEAGMLTLIPCLMFIFWLLSTTGPWFSKHRKRSRDSRSGRRIRKAFGIATTLALVHSIFDVPMHGLGYMVTFSLVAALAMRPRYVGSLTGPLQVWLFRLGGVTLIALGLHSLALAAGLTDLGLSSAATRLQEKAITEAAQGRRAEALNLVQRAIDLTPLDFNFYFLRAQLHLAMRHGSQPALLDFGRARHIEPRYGPMCMEEGRYWLHFDPPMALVPWREGMRRYPTEVPQYFGIVNAAQSYPELFPDLWRLASSTSLQLICLAYISDPGQWTTFKGEFLTQHPGLVDLHRQQVLYFVQLWRRWDDKREMFDYLQKYPPLQAICWQLQAQDLAQSGKFEAAVRLASRNLPMPTRSATLTAADIPRLERAHLLNPIDPLPGVELYYAQRASGDIKAARATLEKVMKLPVTPDFLKREMASVLADSGDMRGAWEELYQIIKNTPSSASFMDIDPQEAADNIQRPSAPEPRGPDEEL
jgi:tetratricopeptide (TPR) repeat protein